ncbi:MAG: M48 family metalloprotease [Gemmatimonadota bacterium]
MKRSDDTRRRSREITGRLAVLALAALGLESCATNPATGKSQLSLIGERREIEMGREASVQVAQTIGIYPDAELGAYVRRIGFGLASVAERPNLPWSFEVVDDPVVNAFALPGGFIYVTRGIMAHLNSEAELAAVVGHEIGHVTARHSVNQISRAQLFGVGLGVSSLLAAPMRGILGSAVGNALGLLTLKYSRGDERQADALGVRYAFKQNYDPRQAIHVHEMLERQVEEAGGSGVPTWLSTHPRPEDRIEKLEAQIDTLDATRLARARVEHTAFLRQVDGLVYGENPRNGFFRGYLFQHPDLEFEIAFPDRWRTQNMSQFVVAVSPRQDAILQLSLAERGNGNEDAANLFFAQNGLRASRVSHRQINGNPATIGTFRASSGQSTVEGVAVFLDYNGNTFQILGYTPGGRYRSYASTFRRAYESFDRLTDREALEAQPMRVQLIETSRRTTISELARSRRSPISVSRLAILNGVGEDETLPAGRTIKWVVGERPPGQEPGRER